MYAAKEGFSRVTRVLLKRGDNPSIAAGDGHTAVHIPPRAGHLAVTTDLHVVKAGAELEARGPDGATPLYLAAQEGHSEAVSALTEAGTIVDSRCWEAATPLYAVAGKGHVDTARELLRAKMDPLVSATISTGVPSLPLDAAAENGYSKVVRELVKQRGMKCCAGASGGVNALVAAAEYQQVLRSLVSWLVGVNFALDIIICRCCCCGGACDDVYTHCYPACRASSLVPWPCRHRCGPRMDLWWRAELLGGRALYMEAERPSLCTHTYSGVADPPLFSAWRVW